LFSPFLLSLLLLLLTYLTPSTREDDFDANQSELKYLKIQLRALEAQCAQYIPHHHQHHHQNHHNEDTLLTESINNWRIDWEDIDRKSKARRKKRRGNVKEEGEEDFLASLSSMSMLSTMNMKTKTRTNMNMNMNMNITP
jgi:hypothetical protein